ncbi:MAG: HNH endonuclease [Phycisphaerales bacterium]|jgi:hypothetical protein
MNSEPELEPGVKILPVVGYEGLYSVTDDGRVWSEERRIVNCDGVKQTFKPLWRTPVLTARGYLCVSLRSGVIHVQVPIHTLVAGAFIGPRPPGLVVDHIDQNPLNNHVGNLRYVTRRVNAYNSDKAKGYRLHKASGRWTAQIRRGGKDGHLGYFKTPEEARSAYLVAKEKLMAELV